MNRGQVIILRFTRNNWTGGGGEWWLTMAKAISLSLRIDYLRQRYSRKLSYRTCLLSYRHFPHIEKSPCKKKNIATTKIERRYYYYYFLRCENDSNFNPFPQTIVRTTCPSKNNFTLRRRRERTRRRGFHRLYPFGIWEKGNEEVFLGSFVVRSTASWFLVVMRPARVTCIYTCIYSARATAFPPTPTPSFALVLKYLGFMNAAAGCINYTTLFHATQRTVPPPGI